MTTTHSMEAFAHSHVFLGKSHDRNARRVWLVVAVTFAMMVAEIAGGSLFGSMALIADGWHMSTHAAALAISALAYSYAKRHVHDARFAFGTGKLGDLGSFVSAIVLAMIALMICYDSAEHLIHPVAIAYREAIAIAALGFVINIGSAWVLSDDHHHHHHDHHHHGHGDQGHDHNHAHDHHAHDHERDLNLRAAYVHVLADAVTSFLAVGGLILARWQHWSFIDPVIGLVGSVVILSWSYSLLRQAGATLLDLVPDAELRQAILSRLTTDTDHVCDLHLWRVGPGHCALVVAIVTDTPHEPGFYKDKLKGLPALSHISVEVNTRHS